MLVVREGGGRRRVKGRGGFCHYLLSFAVFHVHVEVDLGDIIINFG